jgi:2-keto-4-pentenoate hydratase/2-oxohepta-3-ene-1,7-dioic acid hydratase in catechol pathway
MLNTERNAHPMRLVSIRTDDGAEPLLGVVVGDRAATAASLGGGMPRTMAALLADADAGLGALGAVDPARIARDGAPLASLHLAAPVPRPGKVVAIGRNYPDHTQEQGATPPPEPLIFAKFTTAVVGPGDEIRWDPSLTDQVDWEAELAIVIGRTARRVSEVQALDYVLGYTCLDDISARDLQFGDKQWVRGKSLDTFCPIGPQIVTLDEIPNPEDLAISCVVNGETVQHDRTSNMFYGVRRLISHCSNAFTLEPGDVIATGTPGGVGVFRDPPRFLHDGDVVQIVIEGIGTLENRCREEHPG